MAQEVDIADGQKPLAGVVLCCTSLPQEIRNNVATRAEEMGATHKLDLTAEVTHLIVGNIATPKYRYVAKERPDIKVLRSGWIDAVRELWMASEDFDLAELEAEHCLPTFFGLEICVTGIDNMEVRNMVEEKVKRNGGVYHGDLTKVVTHLVAAAPEGKKYEAARTWGLKVVSVKWFTDSLTRGMALDEGLYNPASPEEEQGKGAFRLRPKRTSLGKHGRDAHGDAPIGASKKKLRRTTSTRLESQSQDMWQDISAHNTGGEAPEPDQWTDRDDHDATASLKEDSQDTKLAPERSHAESEPQRLYSGFYILIFGFNETRTKTLRNHLEPNGALVVETPAELEHAKSDPSFRQSFLLVPHAAPSPAIELPPVPEGTTNVTEWWVERCVHYKQLIDPSQDVFSRPLWYTDVSAFKDSSISTTGFEGVDYRHVAEAVKLLGATYDPQLLATTSILICAKQSKKKEKLYYAQRYRIPVVDASWLWRCLESGDKVPVKDHVIDVPAVDANELGAGVSASSPASYGTHQSDTKSASKRKDEHLSTRLSNTRKTKHTPSLPLQSVKPEMHSRASRPGPFVHEDDADESPVISDTSFTAPGKEERAQKVWQPLQELSPNRSPRKSKDTSDALKGAENAIQPQLQTIDNPASPPPPTKQDEVDPKASSIRSRPELEADISDLYRSAASRPSSASEPRPRKGRPLGRAPSGISNRSGSAPNISDRFSGACPTEDFVEVGEEVRPSSKDAFAPPSTQLGYETADAEVHRLQMSKSMGAKFEDDEGFRRVASLGTVKDAVSISSTGVGGRVRGRQRAK